MIKNLNTKIFYNDLPDKISIITHLIPEFHQIENAISISTQPLPYGSWDTEKLYEYIRSTVDDNTKIFFDNAWEGHGEVVLHQIYNVVQDCNLNPRNVYYVSGAMSIKNIHDRFCIKMNIENRIHVYVINTWEHNCRYASEFIQPEYTIKPKSKKFLCFNRVLRHHRAVLLGLLLERNLVKDSYYSFFPFDVNSNISLDSMMGGIQSRLDEKMFSRVYTQLKQQSHTFPLKLNSEAYQNTNTIRTDDVRFFSDSYFSLVTETFYYPDTFYNSIIEHDSVFFSEKIFKPIYMKHPFVLVHRPFALEYLRQLGYKTFHPFINEEYDTVLNDNDRIIKIVDEVERLSNLSDKQWMELLSDIKYICEYNYTLFMNKSPTQRLFYYE
jgi:hypothetical protein